MAEDGPIDSAYSLTEMDGGYRQRNKQNVAGADGTAILYESNVSGGTQATLVFCIHQNKPYKLIDIEVVEPARAAEALQNFINEFNVSTLNIAGPRSSRCLGVYDYVKQVISLVIQQSD